MNYEDVEKSILSILIQYNDKFKELSVNEEHFNNIQNRSVFTLINKVYKDNGMVDIKTLHLIAKDKKRYVDYVGELVMLEFTPVNFWHYQDLLIERWKDQQTKKLLMEYTNNSFDRNDLIVKVNDIDNQYAKVNFNKEFNAEDIYGLITTKSTNLHFTNYNSFNKKIQFLQNTFNVVGARTGIGKSAFALNMMSGLIDNYRCVYVNTEMTEKDIWSRLVGINTNTEIDRIEENEKMSKIYLKTMENIKDRFKIINGSQTLSNLRSILINEQRKGHTIVFIDYIGYIYTNPKHDDRERIGTIARELQSMTKDYDLTIICLAQINRVGNETPKLIHLKDSGELEQSAHIVLLLHDENKEETEYDDKVKIDVIVAKNRSGRKGKLEFDFLKQKQKFIERD